MKDWPIYFKNNLYIGDPESNVGVATLWTKKELIGETLDKSKYNLVGQLYSKKGINYIIRNILANPTTRTIVLCGSDLSGSGQALVNLIEKGLDAENKIIGVADAYIEKEIPTEAIEAFRKNVKVIDLREEQSPAVIAKTIDQYQEKIAAFAEPATYPEPEPPKTERFPSEGSIFRVSGENTADIWVDVLHKIMRFGTTKTSHYDDDIRELLGVTTVTTNENPDEPNLPNWMLGLKREELFEYYQQYLTDHVQEGNPYGYGNRMRAMRGKNQIEFIVKRIKEERDDRGACAVTWNVDTDLGIKSRPCILLVQALVQDDKLNLIAYIRSNDMFQAWPRNNLALMKVQKEIAEAVGIARGDLVVISASAHIYKKDWEDANKVIKNEKKLRCIPDPRGNVVVAIDQEKGTIELSLLSPRGELTAQMTAKDSVDAMEKMTMADWISKLEHAMDLGKQLGWADLALKYGFDFRQDNMPKLEAIAGQSIAPKREIRSGSGANPGDVKKQNDEGPNVCGPEGVCEPDNGTATCDPTDASGNVCV
jgi:thymidylate synthase